MWYHNDKVVHNTENVKVTIKETRTTLTIKKVTDEDRGIYVCKIVSDLGMATTRAKLNVLGTSQTQEVEDVIMEEVTVEKKEKKKKKKKKTLVTVHSTDREPVEATEVIPLETTDQFIETTDTAIAKRTFDVAESVSVSAVASCKKVPDDESGLPDEGPQVAGVVAPIHEAMSITEAVSEEVTGEATPWRVKQRKVETVRDVHEAVSVQETVSHASTEEIITSTTIEERATMVHKKLSKAKVTRTEVKTSEVEEILEEVGLGEFGPGAAPLRELATIDVMLRNGVSVEEVVSLYEAAEFPALRAPDAQSALVSVVEREGAAALLSQYVATTESVEETLVGVFKAFLAVALSQAEEREAPPSVRQVLTLFQPQDFRHSRWDVAMPVIAEETATETVTEMRQVETQGTGKSDSACVYFIQTCTLLTY